MIKELYIFGLIFFMLMVGVVSAVEVPLNKKVNLNLGETVIFDLSGEKMVLTLTDTDNSLNKIGICDVELNNLEGSNLVNYRLVSGIPFVFTADNKYGFLVVGYGHYSCSILIYDENISCSDGDNSFIKSTDRGLSYPPGGDRNINALSTIGGFNGYVVVDTCVDKVESWDGNNFFYAPVDKGDILIEMSCLDGKMPYPIITSCPNSCSEGLCIKDVEACPDFPCVFDGKATKNQWSTVDSPPRSVSANYPYTFEIPESQNVFLTILAVVWSRDPEDHSNKMYVKVDGKIVYSESKTISDENTVLPIEIDLGTIDKGVHELEIFAIPDSQHFVFDWFKLDSKTKTAELPEEVEDIQEKIEIINPNEAEPVDLTEETQEDQEATISYICNGCELDDKCYPMGYRKEGKYCSDDLEFKDQFIEDSSCDNNFECKSNVCVSGECVSEGLIKKILNWFKRLFGMR